MCKYLLRAAWVEIDLGRLDRNIKNIIDKAKGSEVIGVIKADAYGHGAVKCAEVLRNNGIKVFAVATLEEAISLRAAGALEEIIILGLTPNICSDVLVRNDITPVVCDYGNAESINLAAHSEDKIVDILIAVDTGMGRIGYLYEDLANAISDIKRIADLSNLRIKGLFSHFATADSYDKSFSRLQESRYIEYYDALYEAGVKIPVKTLANSASIMELPTAHFDAVRPGIVLYGCYPSNEVDRGELEISPVMSVKANIVQLKDVPTGFSCSYGRKFITERPSKIATIPLGYADGLPRSYSDTGMVIVNGVICPIAGTICMDQFMVDVTEVPEVSAGDEVVLMGESGDFSITAEDIAAKTGTISYEICCRFGQRLPKIYI